jgi:putative membrane protein insertion efficiency factor
VGRFRTELAGGGSGAVTAPAGPGSFGAKLLRSSIRAYQLLVSPLLGPSCRFEPSCSHFAETAIARYGSWRGTSLALRRLLRCHPWGGPGGFDPVP